MEKFSKNYYKGYKESNYLDYSKINVKEQFKTITSFIDKNKLSGNFLDIGCAFGFLVKEAEKNFKNTYGCDISKYALNQAKKNSSKSNFKIVDLDKSLPYPDNYFDLITALDVLEHTKNFSKNLEKISKKLKKNGYLIVSFPINSLLRRLFGFIDKDKTHISVPTEKEALKAIKKSGLKIIKKEKYFAPFFKRIRFLPVQMEIILKK